MITRIQSQPNRNTFGTRVDKSLDGMLTQVAEDCAKRDGNNIRVLSYEPNPYFNNTEMLAMTVQGKGKAFFGLFMAPENIKQNLSEAISRFSNYLDSMEASAVFIKD